MYLILLCYMCLYFRMMFQELFCKRTVTLLYGVLLVPPSQYCTFPRYHVVLPIVTILYFPLLSCCIFSIMTPFLCKIYVGSYTSLNEYSYFLFLLLCTSGRCNIVLSFMKVIFIHIYEGPCVFPSTFVLVCTSLPVRQSIFM
jgi:hypothetical protein